jgi:hypothetical protein
MTGTFGAWNQRRTNPSLSRRAAAGLPLARARPPGRRLPARPPGSWYWTTSPVQSPSTACRTGPGEVRTNWRSGGMDPRPDVAPRTCAHAFSTAPIDPRISPALCLPSDLNRTASGSTEDDDDLKSNGTSTRRGSGRRGSRAAEHSTRSSSLWQLPDRRVAVADAASGLAAVQPLGSCCCDFLRPAGCSCTPVAMADPSTAPHCANSDRWIAGARLPPGHQRGYKESVVLQGAHSRAAGCRLQHSGLDAVQVLQAVGYSRRRFQAQ